MRSVLFATLLMTACPSPSTEPAPADAPAATEPAAADGALSGMVAETMDAAGYTYVHLQTKDGMRWAAVSQTPLQVGDHVQVTNFTWMQDFHSKSLDRTFDQIAFGQLAQGGASSPRPAAGGSNPHAQPVDPYGGMPRQLGEGSDGGVSAHGAAPAVAVDAPIAKAEGDNGHTVAEVFASKGVLDGKPVSVRGKVVKFTENVMGTNWVHVQDGSGAAAASTHDLTVTTSEKVEVGEVVVLTGTLTANKDLGAGYTYAALLENATVQR